MRARTINFATLLSATVAGLLTLLWLRGLVARDRIALPIAGRYGVVTTFPHHLYLDCDPGWSGMRGGVDVGLPQYPAAPRYLEPRVIPRTVGAWSLAIPLWLPLLFASALPARWTIRAVARRRRRADACGTCGYDLRASPGRCPECGQASDEAPRCTPAARSR